MDILNDYLPYGFQGALQSYRSYNTYLRPVWRFLNTSSTRSYPLLAPYLDQVAQLAQSSSPILTVGVFVIVVLILVKILNVVRRILAFWVRLVFRLAFWAAMVLVASLVVQRGLGRTMQDLWYWGQELAMVWTNEYEKWDGMNKRAAAGNAKGGGRMKMGSTNARGGWR